MLIKFAVKTSEVLLKGLSGIYPIQVIMSLINMQSRMVLSRMVSYTALMALESQILLWLSST